MNFVQRISAIILAMVFAFGAFFQASAVTVLDLDALNAETSFETMIIPEQSEKMVEAPKVLKIKIVIIIIIKKKKFAELKAIESFASDGGLGGTRIAAEAEVRGNRFIMNLSSKDAQRLAQLEGVGLTQSMRLSGDISEKLGKKGLTLKAGKFTDMQQVKEKNMLWFEIQ